MSTPSKPLTPPESSKQGGLIIMGFLGLLLVLGYLFDGSIDNGAPRQPAAYNGSYSGLEMPECTDYDSSPFCWAQRNINEPMARTNNGIARARNYAEECDAAWFKWFSSACSRLDDEIAQAERQMAIDQAYINSMDASNAAEDIRQRVRQGEAKRSWIDSIFGSVKSSREAIEQR